MKTSAQWGSAEKPSKNRLDEARHKMNNLPKRLLLEKIVPSQRDLAVYAHNLSIFLAIL
jgi:hypothetical protein